MPSHYIFRSCSSHRRVFPKPTGLIGLETATATTARNDVGRDQPTKEPHTCYSYALKACQWHPSIGTADYVATKPVHVRGGPPLPIPVVAHYRSIIVPVYRFSVPGLSWALFDFHLHTVTGSVTTSFNIQQTFVQERIRKHANHHLARGTVGTICRLGPCWLLRAWWYVLSRSVRTYRDGTFANVHTMKRRPSKELSCFPWGFRNGILREWDEQLLFSRRQMRIQPPVCE